jgi:hypothetical protein
MIADDFSVPRRVGNSRCNDLVQRGEEIELSGSRGAPPTAAGGTIEDGTYVLSSSTLYTHDRPDGAKLVEMGRITVVVNGTTSQLLRNTPDGRERRTTIEREASGTTTTLRTTCAWPNSSSSDPSSTTSYSATGTSFQYITPGPAGMIVSTYTKL